MSANSFADALGAWKDINLGEVQKTLDTQGIELVENQKESVISRKALAERTKDFRKLPDEEKLNAFKSLLKAYQSEIDSLTRRCKNSENVFLSVYKVLAEAPDPYPLLDLAVDQTVKISQVTSLESEVTRLRQENNALQSKLEGQGSNDRERRKAERKVEIFEERMEDLVKERVSAKENELRAIYEERLLNYEEREKDLQRQVTTAKTQLRELRSANDSKEAQLLDHSQRQDQEAAARLSELDLVIADLERANSRVATVERRNEVLRAEIETLRSGTDSESVQKIRSLESTLETLESSHDQLSQSLENEKRKARDIHHELEQKVGNLIRDHGNKSLEVDSLKKRLLRYSDYDEIKRELEIMKYVEFAGAEAEEELGVPDENRKALKLPDPNGDKASESKNSSLEALLASKNKHLQDELAKFRMMHSELEFTVARLTSEVGEGKAEIDRQKALNERIEQDLLNIQKTDGIWPDETSQNAGGSEVDLAQDGAPVNGKVQNGPIPFAPSAETSILPIVTSQRDRFRQRNAELEEEIRKQSSLMVELRTEIKALQGDNLKLYEKLRYMQSYRDDAGSSQMGGKAGTNPYEANDDLDKYRSRYEESMNPFTKFQSREATRAVQALNPLEGAVLTLTRHILGSRRARITFIAYAASLHFLVLFTLYECLGKNGDAGTGAH